MIVSSNLKVVYSYVNLQEMVSVKAGHRLGQKVHTSITEVATVEAMYGWLVNSGATALVDNLASQYKDWE